MRHGWMIAVALAAWLPGCAASEDGGTAAICAWPRGGICQEDNCTNEVRLEIERSGAWTPGSYLLGLVVDGMPFECSLSFVGGESDAHARFPQTGFCDVRPWEVFVDVICSIHGCEANGRIVLVARTQPPRASGDIPVVTPTLIEMELAGPQGLHVQRTITPDYTCTPNCPPCAQAYETVVVTQ